MNVLRALAALLAGPGYVAHLEATNADLRAHNAALHTELADLTAFVEALLAVPPPRPTARLLGGAPTATDRARRALEAGWVLVQAEHVAAVAWETWDRDDDGELVG
jgi:hypothetical protein